MRRLAFVLLLAACLVPHARGQEGMPRVSVGLAGYTTGPGVMAEVGFQALNGSARIQYGGYLNLDEDGGEPIFSFAGDNVLAVMGGFRPGGGHTEYAFGVGRVFGLRYVDCNDGEGGACGADVSGLSLHVEIGSAPRRKLGVGVRLMAIVSRPLSGVGAALTLGVH